MALSTNIVRYAMCEMIFLKITKNITLTISFQFTIYRIKLQNNKIYQIYGNPKQTKQKTAKLKLYILLI
jgi:hypothetical protein